MSATAAKWYERHTGYAITLIGQRPDGREQWYVTCRCGWYGTFISRRAAVLAHRRHKGPW